MLVENTTPITTTSRAIRQKMDILTLESRSGKSVGAKEPVARKYSLQHMDSVM
jgi:hypothetical protein